MSLRPRGSIAWLVGVLGAVVVALATAALPVLALGCLHPGYMQVVDLAEHPEFALKDELPVDLDVTVSWIKCGSANGFWTPHHIQLCKENEAYGAPLQAYIFLHELGHEAVYEYGPKLEDGDEATADSFAVIMAMSLGRESDILISANIFDAMAKKYPWNINDPHPPMAERASTWRCIIEGGQSTNPCTPTWRRVTNFWYKTLTGPKVAHEDDEAYWVKI